MIIGLWVVCLVLCVFIASQKNRGTGNWFLGGALFGPFALIALLASPALEAKPKVSFWTGRPADAPPLSRGHVIFQVVLVSAVIILIAVPIALSLL